jgi:hypothetical protein
MIKIYWNYCRFYGEKNLISDQKKGNCVDILTRDVVNELSQAKGETLVSIYMPTHRVGREMQQDPIRLKNLLSKAETVLEKRGLGKTEIDDLLKPVETLNADGEFWQHQSDGLALFLSANFFKYYRLPIEMDELLVVSERFHLKPLFTLMSNNGQFYVLALSQKDIRLLHGSRFSITQVDLGNVPTSLREALWFDDPEKQLQFHTATSTPGGTGKRPSIFHGHGANDVDEKNELLRYFQRVDKGLGALLGNENDPLVLAGVDYLVPIYQQANGYPHLIESFIEGNPDELSPEELHQRAWEILEPIFQEEQQQALDKFLELHHSGSDLASSDKSFAVAAAHYGLVETLFVALGVQQRGSFDPQKNEVEWHKEFQPGDQDLLDLAAVQTLKNGGTVYALEPENMPENTLLAAIFRYSLDETMQP